MSPDGVLALTVAKAIAIVLFTIVFVLGLAYEGGNTVFKTNPSLPPVKPAQVTRRKFEPPRNLASSRRSIVWISRTPDRLLTLRRAPRATKLI